MITLIDAFNIFLKHVKELRTNTIHDVGEYYYISNAYKGDFASEDYLINKKTGEIREINFLEANEVICDAEDRNIIKTYHIINGEVVED